MEDEDVTLKLFEKMLRQLGYDVLCAGTPDEAMQLAEEHGADLSLLITDVVMPEMNGREMADRLQLLYPQLACLFTSGYTKNVIAHQGILEQGVFFIQKPFTKMELAEKVRSAIASKPG